MRAKARADKDWALSDKIRDQLAELGIQLKDGKDGTTYSISWWRGFCTFDGMEAIDKKILKELQSLPEELKLEILQFIKGSKETTPDAGKDYPLHNQGQMEVSLSENFEEYVTDSFISSIKSLPRRFQKDLMTYLNKLKAEAAQEGKDSRKGTKSHSDFRPGFGGAKGFFILKDGWDDPLIEEFKDYM